MRRLEAKEIALLIDQGVFRTKGRNLAGKVQDHDIVLVYEIEAERQLYVLVSATARPHIRVYTVSLQYLGMPADMTEFTDLNASMPKHIKGETVFGRISKNFGLEVQSLSFEILMQIMEDLNASA